MNKYRNIPTEVDGLRFASKKEAKRYSELRLLERAGEITNLEPHPAWHIVVNSFKICRYTADFRYTDKSGTTVVEDVKSGPTKTRDYRIRKKLMKAVFGIDIIEV